MASKKKKSACTDHDWSKWGVGWLTNWFEHGYCTRSHRVCKTCRKIEWKTTPDRS